MDPNSIASLIIEYRYWILIPLSFVEGPVIAFVAGTFAWLGYFNPYIAFSVFLLRDIMTDAFFYFLGRFGGQTVLARRIMRRLGVKSYHLDDVRLLWERHGFKTMFLSKLTYGLSSAFLLVAGIAKIPYSSFFRYALFVTLIQYGILFSLGYYFGNTIGSVSNIVNALQYIMVAVALFALGYYAFSRYMRIKLLRDQEKIAEKKEL